MPDRAFTLKPMERSLPRRDWRWTRSQSILIAMEVFSWRSGPVGFGRTEDIPFQRSKASSGDMSESCPDYPGQIRSNPLSANLYPGHPRFRLPFYRSKGQQQEDDHRARFVCSGHIHSSTPSLTLQRYSKAVRLSGSRWRQPGQTGSVALFERGEHQGRLVRVKQEESGTSLAQCTARYGWGRGKAGKAVRTGQTWPALTVISQDFKEQAGRAGDSPSSERTTPRGSVLEWAWLSVGRFLSDRVDRHDVEFFGGFEHYVTFKERMLR